MVGTEESKGLSKLIIAEFSGSFQAHEVRMNRSAETMDEKAFQVKIEASNLKALEKIFGRR